MKDKVFIKSQIINLCLALLTMFIGIFLLSFPIFGLDSIVLFLSTLFMLLAMFHFIAYFINRRKDMYESLFNTLIYIISGVFLFIFQYKTPNIMLGTGLLIMTIMLVANRSYYALWLKANKDSAWGIKFLVTFLIVFLSALVISNVYRGITPVQTMILGYYFLTFGILMALEPALTMLFKSETFDSIMNSLFIDNELSNNKTKSLKKKVKSIPTKKPLAKKKNNTTTKKKSAKSLTKKK